MGNNLDLIRRDIDWAIERLHGLNRQMIGWEYLERLQYANAMMAVLETCGGIQKILEDAEALAVIDRKHALETESDE